jgi:IclR family transcriptional regulator, acetate operon repressor
VSRSNSAPIDKTLAILETVAALCRPASITDISVATSIPAPTVHRIAAQLVERRLLRRVVSSRRFLPGPRLLQLGLECIQSQIYADKPHVLLKSLAVEVGEFALISMVLDDEQVCIDSAGVHRPSGLHFEQGYRAPLHCTSIGKLYLSQLSDIHLDAWLKGSCLRPYSGKTISKTDELRQHCIEVRRLGYASCNEEYYPGVVGCSVRIPLSDKAGFLGLCISAPSARVGHDQIVRYVPRLHKVAQQISREVERHS